MDQMLLLGTLKPLLIKQLGILYMFEVSLKKWWLNVIMFIQMLLLETPKALPIKQLDYLRSACHNFSSTLSLFLFIWSIFFSLV